MNAYEKYNMAAKYKADQLSGHSDYDRFRKEFDNALILRTGFGLDAIRADALTDLVILRTSDEIAAWISGSTRLAFTKEEQENRTGAVRAAYENICAIICGERV